MSLHFKRNRKILSPGPLHNQKSFHLNKFKKPGKNQFFNFLKEKWPKNNFFKNIGLDHVRFFAQGPEIA